MARGEGERTLERENGGASGRIHKSWAHSGVAAKMERQCGWDPRQESTQEPTNLSLHTTRY